MTNIFCFQGELPPRWEEALDALAPELNLHPGKDGLPLTAVHSDHLAVRWEGGAFTVEWAQPVQFYRALSLLPDPPAPCQLQENPCFETVGMMFDASRNAVLRPETIRLFLRKMALMGMNLAMMYTEDTYEVPGHPYFGYQRGRYAQEELRALDDYADMLGIELCPCIQTLGHLNRVLHWPAYEALQDNGEVLLADREETYALIREMLSAASAPFRSRRIHIGMDEAHGVGLGRHLRLMGYEPPDQILRRHLERVLDITRELGLAPMMWSDMYFRLESPSNGYYDDFIPSRAAAESVAPGVDLVYWDYYHERKEDYALQLKRHQALGAPTVFAGGLWTWNGPAPDYEKARTCTLAGLSACREAGVPLVFATAWGDNGAETDLLSALMGMQLFAEFAYHGSCEEEWMARRTRACCQADAKAFWGLTRFNRLPEMNSDPDQPINMAKLLLYQDPLVQLCSEDLKGLGLDLEAHYGALAREYAGYAAQGGGLAQLWSFYAALAEALAKKSRWHRDAAAAVAAGDRAGAEALSGGLGEAIEAMEALRRAWEALWNAHNKPQGFEVIDGRLGWVCARLDTARRRMAAFAGGEVDVIPELLEPALPFLTRPDGSMRGSFWFGEIASACKIDG